MREPTHAETCALLPAELFMSEAVANLREITKEDDGRGLPCDLVPAYVQSATLIFVADRIATALEAVAESQGRLAAAAENIGAETGFVAEALEKLAEVAGHAAGELAMIADRGLGATP